jgi:hypothetical protein
VQLSDFKPQNFSHYRETSGFIFGYEPENLEVLLETRNSIRVAFSALQRVQWSSHNDSFVGAEPTGGPGDH